MTETETVAEVTTETAKKEQPLSLEQQFINRLHALKENDKGATAKLKRNAGNTLAESRGVHAIFFRLLPHGVPEWQEDHYFLVATLFPLTESAEVGSLGTVMKVARNKPDTGEKGFDRRMEVLLDSDGDQLFFRLRQVIKLLKSAKVRVNWVRLLEDLQKWHYLDRFVQEKWARDYYTG